MKQRGFLRATERREPPTAERSNRRRIQICAENRLARRPDLLDQLRLRGHTVELETCLDQCTRCDACAFALVCGRFRYAGTADELVRKLRQDTLRTEGNW